MEHYSALPKNDRGFAVVFAMTLLSICTLIGIAAMNTSVDETNISANEVVNKQTFFMGDSGAVIASDILMSTEATGLWDDDTVLPGPDGKVSSGSVEIVDGDFLLESQDSDTIFLWNNMTKFNDSGAKSDFKADDDPFVAGAADTDATHTSDPDIRIILPGKLNMEVDVDKIESRFLVGGGVEFGARADSSGSQGMKIIYIMDCMAAPGSAALRGTNGQLNANAPKSEIIVGYRYVLR